MMRGQSQPQLVGKSNLSLIKLFRVTFLLFCCLVAFDSVSAEVTNLVFITTPQTVAVGISSEVITVQLQNSSGLLENATETVDLTFTSTSPTGQFLSATTLGNPVVARINSGSANKNFLYQDSSAGVYTIKVTATGRTSLLTFSAEQQIIVGTSDQQNTESNTTITTSTDSADSSQVSSGQITNVTSAHSSPASLSTSENKTDFEISAGRDRLTTVGNSLVFSAVPTKSQNIPESAISYRWSFGDGTTAQGNNVSHIYRFAGDYSVVVNGNYSDKQAVSRMQVKVISPSISMVRVSGGVEIQNNSKTEINLEGWKLTSPRTTFVFPADTLIPDERKIIFADSITGISGDELRLTNPIDKEIAQIKKVEKNIKAEEIIQKIQEINNEITRLSEIDTTEPVIVVEQNFVETELSEVIEEERITQTASAITVFEAEKTTGLVGRVFAWPIRGFNFVLRLFMEE